MLDRIDELVEIAKKYVKMGYDPIEAIKLAEKKIYEKYLNSWRKWDIHIEMQSKNYNTENMLLKIAKTIWRYIGARLFFDLII